MRYAMDILCLLLIAALLPRLLSGVQPRRACAPGGAAGVCHGPLGRALYPNTAETAVAFGKDRKRDG